MGKLGAALAWAARGFPVFPLDPNGKEPAFGESWNETATTDPDTIRALWTDPVIGQERDYNIGVDCTDRIVVDVDVKDGKDGHNQYMQLGGTYDTLVVRTPSGGFHCYFEGPDCSNANIARDVDIRSHHGYVLAPGSVIDGKPYEIVNDTAPKWVPYAVERLLRAPYERSTVDVEAMDSPASIEAGRRFLESAPVAEQGQRGDELTFITAARLVREFALSVPVAFELLRDNWNERCSPPWSLDELLQKVENAARYGTADLGRLDPSVLFHGLDIPAPPSVFEQGAAAWGNARDPSGIPQRPWMIDRMLMLHQLTVLLAPGSAGKSSVSLAIVAHLAVGRDFGPYKVHTRCRSIVYNGEDDIDEQSRRLMAVCQAYELDYDEVKRNIMLLSADELHLKLAVPGANGSVAPNTVMIDQLIRMASDPEVGLVVYDPLVDVHDVNEIDNAQMNTVMRIMRYVAKMANVASLICHHTTKGAGAKQEDRVGNMDISRGASAIVYKARIAFTLLNASQSDAETYNMQDHERNTWVRMDDAKMNLTLSSVRPTWFHKEAVRIPNGDVVGVFKLGNLTEGSIDLKLRVANTLITHMKGNNIGSMRMLVAVMTMRANEPLWANKTDTEIRRQLEGFFTTAVEVRGDRLQVIREEENGKSNVLVVLR